MLPEVLPVLWVQVILEVLVALAGQQIQRFLGLPSSLCPLQVLLVLLDRVDQADQCCLLVPLDQEDR